MSWLAKVRRYTPKDMGTAESVLSKHATKLEAEEAVATWNMMYQTDTAYVEKWEAEKMYWPTVSDEEFKDILDGLSRY